MPDTSLTDPEAEPSTTSVTTVSGGINLDAGRDVTIGGDVVGRDKIVSTIYGYTVEQVSTLLTQISNTFQPKPFDGRSPYLGLDYFGEDDADRFFGRETLATDLVVRIKDSRFLIIAGPSGSGKSSLVRAGLMHALKQGALPTSDRWLYATLTPGRDPIESLALATARLAKSPEAGDYVRRHKTEADALHKFAESVLSDRPDQRAVIFVDQFEEVFTQVSKEAERTAFLNLLTHAATLESGRVTVLFAIRSDFVSNCAAYPQLNALLNQQFMQVGAMQPNELVSAIARPALQVGLRIDPDLVAQIVNDMQDEPGALPLMQFALKDLFDTQLTRGGITALTLNAYLARGGLHKALERHADAAFAKLNAGEQQLARTIFSSLIEIGRGTQDTRRTAAFDELVPANVESAQVAVVVQRLADARLITTSEQGDKDTVTIAHERLIEAWPWLRKLINENREVILLQNQIAEDAQEWHGHQRDASYLYSGARLTSVGEQLAAKKIVLSGAAQTFVQASLASEKDNRRKRERQRRYVLVGAIGVAAVMTVLAIFGFANALNAQRQSQIAFLRQIGAQSTAELSDHYDLAVLLSLETARLANQLGNTFEGQNSLLRSLGVNSQLQAYLRGHTRQINNVVFSFDSRLLASSSDDGSVRLWDTAAQQKSGEPLGGNGESVLSVALSPDGKTLAMGMADGTVALWDVESRRLRNHPIMAHTNGVYSMAFSPDGRILASGGADDDVVLWDVITLQQIGEPLIGHTAAVYSVAFSPDGNTVASGGVDGIMVWDLKGETAGGVVSQVVTGTLPIPPPPPPSNIPGRMGRPLAGNADRVNSVAFSPDGKILASGGEDGNVLLWDLMSGRQVGDLLVGRTRRVRSVAFSPDGKTLASGDNSHTVILWDVASQQRIGDPLVGHASPVNSVAFSQNGKLLASGDSDGTIILWNVTNQSRLSEPVIDLIGMASNVALSPDGKMAAFGRADGTISLWDVKNGQPGSVLSTGSTQPVIFVAFRPDGKTLAAGDEDGTVVLWDMTSGPPMSSLLARDIRGINFLVFSPDGQTLALGEDDVILLWNTKDRKVFGEIPPLGPVRGAVFSPDGKILATDAGMLWDVATQRALGTLRDSGRSTLLSLAFSPDGKLLASGTFDGAIILWDVASRLQMGLNLTGFKSGVSMVAFSPSGSLLASGSTDGKIGLWDVASRRPIGEPLSANTSRVSDMAFSPDSKTLTSSGDGNIILWDIDQTSWPARACQIVGRNLTRAEWAQYFGDESYRKTCEQWPLEPEAAPAPAP